MDSEKIGNMIGQMFMVGFRGTDLSSSDDIVKDLYSLNIGGVILFDYDVEQECYDRNIKTKKQVIKLIKDLQNIASTPLFIAVDQEGGDTIRLRPVHGYEKTLSAFELGKLNDPATTYLTTRTIASQLSSSGFNLNFAPVVDLNLNKENTIIAKPGRSFSGDPDKVVQYAEIFINEHKKLKVLTCIKHFMGHGSSLHDTHNGFVDVTDTYDQKEKIPFQFLIQKGIVDMVMTAHVFNKKYDTNYPYTLSKQVITDILRDEIGFKGVVISDDLQMRAITEKYSFKDSIIKAVTAGIDIILIGNNISYDPKAHSTAIKVIHDAIKKRELSIARINDSFNRIINLKRKIGLIN